METKEEEWEESGTMTNTTHDYYSDVVWMSDTQHYRLPRQ